MPQRIITSSRSPVSRLSAQLQVQLDQLKQAETHDVEEFNKLVRDQNIPALLMKSSEWTL
jgi:hypothetical protein